MSALIALIGHSASGKSSCIDELGFDRQFADMDRKLGVTVAPSPSEFREWLSTKDTPAVVALSIHTDKLQEYYRAARELRVLLVYLRKSKERVKEHLKLRQPHGELRPQLHQDVTVETYEHFDEIFKKAADRVIECSDMSFSEVAYEVERKLDELIVDPRFRSITPSNADARI